MRFLWIFLLFLILKYDVVLGSTFRGELDDSTFRSIVTSLRDKPEALQAFLASFRESPFPDSARSGLSDDSFKEKFKYALMPVRVDEQITLTGEDIVGSRFASRFPEKVFSIDLSIDKALLESRGDSVYRYFLEQPLGNLRQILLPKMPLEEVIKKIFSVRRDPFPESYPSLVTIHAQGEGISVPGLDALEAHFSTYTTLIRDVHQISSRYEVTVAPLQVLGTGLERSDSTNTWFRGKKTDKQYRLLYRADSEIKGPMIISISQ